MARSLLITCNHFGRGDDELGAKLMGSFLRKLCVMDKKPERIVFYNSGVKLITEGSGVLDALTTLAEQGVELIACGTCLTHFGLLDKIAVGRKSDMQEIAGVITGDEDVVKV
jgi:selenium metabolism protein YedF